MAGYARRVANGDNEPPLGEAMKDKDGNYLSPKKSKTKRMEAIDFVHLWQSSQSLDEFIMYSGMQKSTAVSRASLYRRRGINLKKQTGKGNKRTLNVEMLNSMTQGGE